MFRQGKKERVLEGVLIPGCHSSEGPEGLGSRSSSEAKGKAETETRDRHRCCYLRGVRMLVRRFRLPEGDGKAG